MLAKFGGMFVWGSLIAILTAVRPAAGADAIEQPTTLEQLRRELSEQQRALESAEKQLSAHRRALQDTQRRLDALQGRADDTNKSAAAATVREQSSAAPEKVGQAPASPQDTRPPEIAPLFDQPGVLTPAGRFALEPSLQYTYSSNNRVALVGFTIIPAITIGLIDIRSVNRSSLTGALTARYGVNNRFELEAKVPYVYRKDSTLGRPLATPTVADTAFDSSGSGIGDVEFAARYQLNQGGGDRPYYVGTLRVKTRTGEDPFEVDVDPTTNLAKSLPTGSGFYGIQPGLTVIYPSDPAVFFGGLSYLWNIKRDVNRQVGLDNFGTVDPGDAVSFNFGMGLALNEKASFSLGYDHSIVGKDKIDGTVAPQAQTRQLGNLMLGFAYRLTDKTSVNLSLGAGLTSEAPDVQLMLRVPTTF